MTNPFAAPTGGGGPGGGDLANVGGSRAPVAMDVQPILERAFEIVKDAPGVVIGTIAILVVPQIVLAIVGGVLQAAADTASSPEEALPFVGARLVFQLIGGILNLFLTLGSVRIFTRLARGLDAEVGMIAGEGRYLLGAIGATILLSIGVVLGMILLIVPGIILSIGLQFYLYAMVDRDLGAIEALTESWRLTDGYKMTIFLVNLAIGILALVFTCITLGIGYFAAIPVLALTQAVMYHSLLHAKGGDGARSAAF